MFLEEVVREDDVLRRCSVEGAQVCGRVRTLVAQEQDDNSCKKEA